MADATIKIRGGAGNAVQIQSRNIDAVAPSDTEVLAWNATDAEWEPTSAGAGVTSEWNDTGTVLHPTDSSGTLDNVVVGGTSLANSDIALGVDGAAVFNEQGAAVDFRVESDDEDHMLLVDGGSNRLGVIIKTPPNTLSVSPTQYSTGTASQSAKTVTGVGTTWTTDMIGADFIYADGTSSGRITARAAGAAGNTSITVTTSQTVGSQSYRIHYGGLHVTSAGKFGLGTSTPTEFCEVEGPTPFLSIRNTAETEAGIIFSDSAAPIAQFARLLLDSGSAESGLTAGFSIMTAGGNLTGTIDATASTTVTGVGTAFLTELVVGDRLILRADGTSDALAEIRTITAIASNTSLTVATAFTDLGIDTTPAFEVRAMQFKSNGSIGMGINPTVGGEKVVVDGAIALLEQHSTFVPSTVSTYSKLYSKREDGPRFGTASADLLKSSTEYLRVAYDAGNPDFEIGTGQFTAEGWFMWRASTSASYELISIGRWNESGLECVYLGTNNSFKMYIASTTVIDTGASSFTPTLNQWYHVAFTRDGSSDCRIFVDGTQVGATVNNTGTITANNATGLDGLKVGNESTGTSPWDGWIDEVRISDTARYTSNFTAPTAAFTTDGNTLALYHMDGAAGGSTFTDSSGNGQNLTAVNGATTEIGQAELYAFDGSGNSTKISPHNSEGEWEYYSKNANTGKTVRINMEEVIRDLGELTGKDYIKRG